jgi:pimeloyl-ACP methyl ester carboxylesterase
VSSLAALFISYARDDEAVAATLAAALENAGHTVWWDRRLTGGAEYNRVIEAALDSCDKVIVLWSAHSKNSAWVRDEATVAINSAKIVPVTVDGTAPPLGFRQFHTVDLSEWLAQPVVALPEKLRQALTSLTPADDTPDVREALTHYHQRIAFTRAQDGVTLAHSCLGTGPPLVKAANGYNHLEHELENPLWRHWVGELSRRNTLIRYDQRGTGMSDWKIPELKFDLLVDDLTVVVDAAGVERFDLVAISQGCPVAIAFTARYPERVRKLALINGFAAGWRYSASRDVVESWEALSVLAKSSRNTPGLGKIFANQYFPDATPAQIDWWNKIQEQSASPENTHRLLDLIGNIDVREMLGDVRVPTLVMHCKDDLVAPFEAGSFIASQIPGAEFVALEGSNHLPQSTDACWPELQEELRHFLS